MCCIDVIRIDVEDYIDLLLKKEVFSTYNKWINLISNKIMWPIVVHNDEHPPKVNKQFGRPKLVRRRATDELQLMKRSCSVRCTIHNEWEHN